MFHLLFFFVLLHVRRRPANDGRAIFRIQDHSCCLLLVRTILAACYCILFRTGHDWFLPSSRCLSSLVFIHYFLSILLHYRRRWRPPNRCSGNHSDAGPFLINWTWCHAYCCIIWMGNRLDVGQACCYLFFERVTLIISFDADVFLYLIST